MRGQHDSGFDLPLRALLAAPLQLPGAVRKFFRTRLDRDRATAALRAAFASRDKRFLQLAHSFVYGRSGSPYSRLMQHAGVSELDLADLVRSAGLEGALERLASVGVYLSAEEAKGKSEVVRGSLRFTIRPGELSPRRQPLGLPTESSGTSARPTRSISSFGWLERESVTTHVFVAAHRLENHAHCAIDVITPGAAGMLFLMMVAKSGIVPERWFCRRPHHGWPERIYHSILASEVVFQSRRYGPGFPSPEFIDFQDFRPVVTWSRERARAGKGTCIRCVASVAVGVAKTALETGVSLDSTVFIATGEPFTESKREIVESSGAGFTVQYGYTPGAVHVGRGCAARCATDEMHVDLSTLAVIAHSRTDVASGGTVRPLLFTTLYPEASVFQLNLENGDSGVLERRRCGCLLGDLGFDLLLRRVRSFEKLTCRGMNYAFADLYPLLEERLPQLFGGGPGDYQLVEHPVPGGEVHLTLRVDPGIGPLDEDAILQAVQEGLGSASRSHEFMATLWQEAGVLRVRRESPRESSRGKIPPLVLEQNG